MTKETKQTAVEWIYVELYKFLSGKSEFQEANDILNKAKEMEKEQIVDAWISDRQFIIWSGDKDDITDDEINELANDYYNETYGGNK